MPAWEELTQLSDELYREVRKVFDVKPRRNLEDMSKWHMKAPIVRGRIAELYSKRTAPEFHPHD
eukprot:282810-Pleurochrysis_carterae.AAC.1